MRNLFFAFVLANLGFAAWHAWFTEAAPEPAPSAQAAAGIMLVSEVPEEGIELAAEPTGVPADPALDEPAESTAAVDVGDDTEAALDTAARENDAPARGGADTDSAADAASAVDAGSPADAGGAPDASGAAEAGSADGDGALDAGGALTAGGSRDAAPDPVAGDDAALARPAEAPRQAALSCVSVGPFRELSQAATAGATLREQGLEPIQRAGEGDIWVGYWVYIEQIPSVARANEILALLRDNGIADSYVIPSSDSGTLISLGVFTEITRAGRRREEVRALGHDATISDRTRRATVYWIDVMLPLGDTLDFEQLQPAGRIIRLEQRPCGTADD